jgi:hypothetical protein
MGVLDSIYCEHGSCRITQWHPDPHRMCGRSILRPAAVFNVGIGSNPPDSVIPTGWRASARIAKYPEHLRMIGREMDAATGHASSTYPSRRPARRKLFLPACYQEYNAANECHCACDGRQRYIMCLVASSVNRSDVNDRFPGRVGKTSPRKTEQAKYNQDNPKRFVHGSFFPASSPESRRYLTRAVRQRKPNLRGTEAGSFTSRA